MKYETMHRRIYHAALLIMAASVGLFAVVDTASAVDTVTVVKAANTLAVATPDSVMVGDPITLGVAFRVPKGARVVPPETERGFGDFAVMSRADTVIAVRDSDSDSVLYQYTVATYKPQNCTIPSLIFLAAADTVYDTLVTQQIPISIISIIPPGTPDSGLAIKDLKPQQKTGSMSLRSLWILLLIVLAALVYYLIEKHVKRKAAAEPPTVKLIPPYEEAIQAIEELEGKRYLERGSIKEYTFELSDIFKRYIGRRYDTIASEFTTEEIVAWLEYSGISREMRLCAERFFRTGDQVKFAKWKPDQQTLDSFMKDVKTFLEATKPNPELQYEQKTERIGAVE